MKSGQPNIPFGPVRVLGTYPQRQEGFFMQRIPLLGGRIEPPQLKRIVEIARTFTGNTPLHLTTRQDIELHNVAEADVAKVQAELADIGISTYGACGDCVRNIQVCPCCGFDPSAVDVYPLARMVRDALLTAAATLDLPRKFKISFCGCRSGAGRAYIQDLGFEAVSPDAIRVIGAGSLGARPMPGVLLYEAIAPDQVLPLIRAALEVFTEHGDRGNRRTARLRHIRQRMGDAAFKTLLDQAFESQKRSAQPTASRLSYGQDGFGHRVVLQTLGGDLTCDEASALAEIARANAAKISINLWHGVDLFSPAPLDLPESLERLTGRPRIIACPGSSTCTNGLTDCRTAARAMAEALQASGRIDQTVGISGCANNCALSAVCDIGLVGRLKTIDGVRQEAYDVYTGGGNGANEKLAERTETVSAADLKQHFSR